MKWTQKVTFILEAVKQPPDTPGRSEAIVEAFRMAHAADTYNAYVERGLITAPPIHPSPQSEGELSNGR